MTEKKFLKRALWAPLLFPIVIWLAGLILQPFTSAIYDAGTFLMTTLIFAGVPYLVFVFLFSRWQQNKNAGQIKLASLIFPIIFLIIFWVYFSGYMFFLDSSITSLMEQSFYLALLSSGQQVLLLSYGYVIAAHVVFFMFKQTGRIEPRRNAKIVSQKKPYQGIPAKKNESSRF